MPYSSIAELPKQFDGLPDEAKRIAMHVINSELERGLPEDRAFAAAWSQVKKFFHKNSEGKWVKMSESDFDINQDELMEEAEWDTAYINDLPDSAFAYIEPGGKKDEEGKTVPRSKRHFPIRDASGKLDPAHVRNAAARAPQSPFGEKAMPVILAAKRELGIGEDNEKKESFDVSEAIHLLEANKEGSEWAVIVIQSGWSMNGNYYPRDVLHRDYKIFEGVPCYAAAGPDHNPTERGVRSIVGWIHECAPHPLGIGAKLHVSDKILRESMLDAWSHGKRDLYGLSIRADGRGIVGTREGRQGNIVEGLIKGHSVDLVTAPSAGGKIADLLESAQPNKENEHMPEITDEIKATISEEVKKAVTASVKELVESLNPNDDPIKRALEDHQKKFSEMLLNQQLADSNLPEASKERIRKQFAGKVFEEAQLSSAIADEKNYLAKLNPVSIKDFGRSADVIRDEKDKLVKALDGYFAERDLDGVGRFKSYKEAYCRFTGADFYETGANELMLGLCNSKGSRTLEEALTTSDWAEVFADRLRKRMLDVYAEPLYDSWRKFCQIGQVPDFYTHRFIRTGGYAMTDAASQVSEGATYPEATSPGDEEITVKAVKRGTIDYITKEMLLGDNLGAIPRIPVAMARWMKRLVHNSIYLTLMENNATIYDGEAFFVAAGGSRGQYNTAAAALSASTVSIGRYTMRQFTAYGESGFVLGALNEPRFLIVPAELQDLGQRIVGPGMQYLDTATTNTDTGFDPAAFKGIELIVVDELTDPNDWYLVADPAKVPTILVVFLNGQQEPTLTVADLPKAGSMFTADKIGYRVDMAWDAKVCDYSSFYKGTQ